MKNTDIIPGTFPGTTIVPELNEKNVPVGYTLLKDGDEQASLPVHTGSPEIIRGFTTEDLINVAIHRLQTLNGYVPSPLNLTAIEQLSTSLESLCIRQKLTSDKVDEMSVNGYIVKEAVINKRKCFLAGVKGFLFLGFDHAELVQNINTANVACYKDFAKLGVDVDLTNWELRYFSRGGQLVRFIKLEARG